MEDSQPTADNFADAVKGPKPIHPQGSQHASLRVLEGIFTTARGWWLIFICVAAIMAWPARNHHIAVDTVSYLDIGREVSSGDLSELGKMCIRDRGVKALR